MSKTKSIIWSGCHSNNAKLPIGQTRIFLLFILFFTGVNPFFLCIAKQIFESIYSTVLFYMSFSFLLFQVRTANNCRRKPLTKREEEEEEEEEKKHLYPKQNTHEIYFLLHCL